jgi:uncharacterized surface anchored protein
MILYHTQKLTFADYIKYVNNRDKPNNNNNNNNNYYYYYYYYYTESHLNVSKLQLGTLCNSISIPLYTVCVRVTLPG